MVRERMIRLGYMDDGVGGSTWGWRQPGVDPDASVSIARYEDTARRAEAAKLDFLFIADSLSIGPTSSPHFLNRLEPLTLLSAVSRATSNIGLAATISTSFEQPFTVARQLASLDVMSRGRAGWNVVTSALEGAALNHSCATLDEHDERYRRAEEHVDVCRGLWDSWEDDAFVHDKAAGIFFTPEKLHPLGHKGAFYQVKGPLNIRRSPQGHPVIFQAGASKAGRELAAQKHPLLVFGRCRTVSKRRNPIMPT
ncbi:NtaA/DmoA family FMN-dependent monooxygenase [Sphingopyxis sp.]|uniref:NtaA/DmoA family FMN-dependent monooxygenase n=1 Tax=Sphingopyxis sp. TaxID=1908224 RepID=UPI00345910F8